MIGEVISQYENATITTQGDLDILTGSVETLLFSHPELGKHVETTFESVTGDIHIICPKCRKSILVDGGKCSNNNCSNPSVVQQSLILD